MNTNDLLWDDNPIDVSSEANFIWSIANKLRGTYMPDKYGDVIIPMTILRRFECALKDTKNKIISAYKENPSTPAQKFQKITGYQFYNTSNYDLKELCNEPDSMVDNFNNYLDGFSSNVQDIMKQLKLQDHIKTMDEGGCLYSVVEAFSDLDLDPSTYDSIKMGYIFENLIGRFYQNVDAGQFYTGRDIIKLLVSILTSEGSDDIFEDHKVITVCDQACGTGGMLSTAYSYLKHVNNTADVRLFGQEFMGPSYAVGLAEMLIKGQDARNFRHADTFKEDCFKDIKMRYVIENPPFGTPWSGKDAKEGQEKAVIEEYEKGQRGSRCRWGAGLPSGGESQLIFMQSAIDKMDDKVGRAAIIENGSPLFSGNTASGESQIRKWMLQNDLIEAIISLPVDLFYNTGIQTYIWVLSKNKRAERKGKVALIDASRIYHKLRKAAGNKKNELTPADRLKITELYTKFENNSLVKIFDNNEFIYREYTVMQPLQRSYAINEKRIDDMISKGALSSIYDEVKVAELEDENGSIDRNKKHKLDSYYKNKQVYTDIIKALSLNVSQKIYYDITDFRSFISKILPNIDNCLLNKIIDGLSQMDKSAKIQRDKNGNILYDKDTKTIELVKFKDTVEEYMKREVYPHIKDAKAFFEENLTSKKHVVKTGAEIPFTRYFYKYEKPEESNFLVKEIKNLEIDITMKMKDLFR